jgi:hypothetical protein
MSTNLPLSRSLALVSRLSSLVSRLSSRVSRSLPYFSCQRSAFAFATNSSSCRRVFGGPPCALRPLAPPHLSCACIRLLHPCVVRRVIYMEVGGVESGRTHAVLATWASHIHCNQPRGSTHTNTPTLHRGTVHCRYGDSSAPRQSVIHNTQVEFEFQQSAPVSSLDLEGDIDTSDTHVLLPGPATRSAPTSGGASTTAPSCLSVEYFQKFFDVDTEQVLHPQISPGFLSRCGLASNVFCSHGHYHSACTLVLPR